MKSHTEQDLRGSQTRSQDVSSPWHIINITNQEAHSSLRCPVFWRISLHLVLLNHWPHDHSVYSAYPLPKGPKVKRSGWCHLAQNFNPLITCLVFVAWPAFILKLFRDLPQVSIISISSDVVRGLLLWNSKGFKALLQEPGTMTSQVLCHKNIITS